MMGHTFVYRGYNDTPLDYAMRRAVGKLMEDVRFQSQPDYDYTVLKGNYGYNGISFGMATAFVKYRPASCRNKDNGDDGDNGDDKKDSSIWDQLMANWWIIAIVAVIVLVGVLR